MANLSTVLAAKGPKDKTAVLNYQNMGIVNIEWSDDLNLGFGLFDKMIPSTLGAADCFDFFGTNDAGDLVALGVATDSEEYANFYDEVFAGLFPPAILLEEDELEIWKHGSDIYVETTVPLTFFNFVEMEPIVIPPFSIKVDSVNQPYKEITDPTPLPSGWTFQRITQRGYDAIVTFDCPALGIVSQSLGVAQFNTLDVFSPPPT